MKQPLADQLIEGCTPSGAVRRFLRQSFGGGESHPREQGSNGIRLALSESARQDIFEVLEAGLLEVQLRINEQYAETFGNPATQFTETGTTV